MSGPMLPTILVPNEISEWCYLNEALYWVAIQRFPLAQGTENGVDQRQDREYVEGIDPNLPFDLTPTSVDCERAGISSNPIWEDILSGDSYHPEPSSIRELLK